MQEQALKLAHLAEELKGIKSPDELDRRFRRSGGVMLEDHIYAIYADEYRRRGRRIPDVMSE